MSRLMMIKQLARLSEASNCSLRRALYCTSTTIPADVPSLKAAAAPIPADVPSLTTAAAAPKDSSRGPRVHGEFTLGERVKTFTMYQEEHIASLHLPQDVKDALRKVIDGITAILSYSKEDLKLYVEEGVVYIAGKGTDILGQPDDFNRKVVIPPDFLYDPECGTFDARKGQVKITLPYAKGQCNTQKTGRFPLQPSSDLD